ncbi:Uncharacterised protein [Serratia fonticola]|uniref:Uncharacterized protein n=1 Tax=Serratia fonticola TaxID=47917 RepID=A0A4U9TN31_SERFO|nr:Uncharacterised protein [Serratia fonticola]
MKLSKIDNGALRALCNGLTLLLKWPLVLAYVDRLQVLNNQCLSTNMTSSHWQTLDTDALRQQALQRYPQHTLMIRSLNDQQTPEAVGAALPARLAAYRQPSGLLPGRSYTLVG